MFLLVHECRWKGANPYAGLWLQLLGNSLICFDEGKNLCTLNHLEPAARLKINLRSVFFDPNEHLQGLPTCAGST